MEMKRSPGLVITLIGVGLALLTIFGSDLPFAPSSMFLPFMMILVGRAISRGSKSPRKKTTPTTFRMPPTVPPPSTPAPVRPAKSAPPAAPVDTTAPAPALPQRAPEPRELEERLRSAKTAAEARPTPEPAELHPDVRPAILYPEPIVGSTHLRDAVYPSPTPSSAKAKSSKEMVEEAKQRIKRS